MTTITDVDNQARIIGDELDVRREVLLDQTQDETNHSESSTSWIEPRAEKFATFLEEFVGILDHIRSLDNEWRIHVYRGDLEFTEPHNFSVRSLYVIWVLLADNLKERYAFFVRHGVNLSVSLEKLSELRQEVTKSLHDWQKPVKTKSPSLRFRKLSPEATQRLKELYPDLF